MLNLPKIKDPRGNLSFIEAGSRGTCPFEIESVAWSYDVPGGNNVAVDHGTASLRLAAALSGSFDIGCHQLNRSDRAVFVPEHEPLVLANVATNSVALILGSATGGNLSPKEEDPSATTGEENHRASDVGQARIIELPRKPLPGGGSVSCVVNGQSPAPFDVRRIFYLYDVPADATRGGHSHHQARELIVAMSGSFDVVLDDGKHEPRRFTLNRPYQALYVPPGLWRTLDNFSGGSVSAVLTSHRFSESDYVRHYSTFLSLCARNDGK